MKLSYTTSLLLFLGVVNAVPARLTERAPSNAPINLEHGPDPTDSFQCGTATYTGHTIYISAQRGVNLKLVGETRGRYQYPHKFGNKESLALPSHCPADDNLQEFPLMAPVYDGGKNNVKQGDERVLYYWVPGDIDFQGNPNAKYCGIMTHVGAPTTGGFLLC